MVGRERELATVSAFLDSIPSGPRALLIEGQAGIGKTTIWLEAVRAAERRSYCVVKARPAESEARLSYATVADIVGPVFDEAGRQLPVPQERALAATLLRVATEAPADPRTTATALVGVLTVLARERPVLVAIDDVQWVDSASERALQFAVRRVPPQLGLLVARRMEGAADAPLGLDAAIPQDRLVRVVPRPLSLASLHHVVCDRLRSPVTRPTLARIAEASGGNPFFAIEIARALAADNASEIGGLRPLPVPRSLQRLAAERVSALSSAAREAVLVAASLSRPTIDAVVAALASDSDALMAVVEAEESGVLVTEDGRVRFTHPLLASAVYASASDARRRLVHQRLATVVSDAEERARHLAQSATEVDESTASEVEHAARQAALRGAFDAAAELFRSRVSPDATRGRGGTREAVFGSRVDAAQDWRRR